MSDGQRASTSPGVRIAHVTTVDLSLRYLLLNQLVSFRDAGLDVTGISSPGPDVATLEDAGIRHVAVPMTRAFSPLRDLVALLSLARALRREKFTMVHTHTPKGGLLGQYAALLAGVPLRVHTIHGLYFPAHASRRLRWAFVMLERVTMAFSAHNFSQNPEDVPLAIAERISRPEKLEFIGNGIDVREFDPQRRSIAHRTAIRESLGLTRDDLVVGTVGRLVREKGYQELLLAARIVRERCCNVRFLIVGGPEPQKPDAITPELARELGVTDVVRFLGHRNDVADLYSIMDVFALPSYREGFPRAPMEAAASGVPVVVTDVRGCRETVARGETGYMVPARDPEALAGAILALLEDQRLRERFGAAGREKAVREFDERIVFQRILRTYERLLGGLDSERRAGTRWSRNTWNWLSSGSGE